MAASVKPVYTLGGSSLATLGVYVSSATGLFSLPKLKTPQTVDWPDKNGVVVDLATPRYQPREIVLNCYSKGATGAAALSGLTSVINILKGSGLKTLTVSLGATTYSYSVYAKDGVDLTRKYWGDGKVVIEFTVKLEEPHPVNFVPSDTPAEETT